MKRVTTTLAALALLFGGVTRIHAAMIHNYDLNGSYADSLGGPSLVPVPNGGTLGATGYTFGPGQGL